jgi:hypothetical protein
MHGVVLQLLISVTGVALMIGACALMFGTRDALISGADAVAGRLASDVPGFLAGRTAVSRDGRAALVENRADGSVYLAVVRGDEIVTRKLSHGAFESASRDKGMLSVKFDEFTLGYARLDLGDGETAGAWEAHLKAIAG